jgi:hypothetical protein
LSLLACATIACAVATSGRVFFFKNVVCVGFDVAAVAVVAVLAVDDGIYAVTFAGIFLNRDILNFSLLASAFATARVVSFKA